MRLGRTIESETEMMTAKHKTVSAEAEVIFCLRSNMSKTQTFYGLTYVFVAARF